MDILRCSHNILCHPQYVDRKSLPRSTWKLFRICLDFNVWNLSIVLIDRLVLVVAGDDVPIASHAARQDYGDNENDEEEGSNCDRKLGDDDNRRIGLGRRCKLTFDAPVFRSQVRGQLVKLFQRTKRVTVWKRQDVRITVSLVPGNPHKPNYCLC